MSDAQVLQLANRIGSPFAAELVEAMPEPAILVGTDGRAVVANRPHSAFLPD